MNPINPIWALIALVIALFASQIIVRIVGEPGKQARYVAVDGLRGFLALFVFIHHSSVWYFYLKSGQWKIPPSHLYTNLGQGSVALFFMITGFLFYGKLLDGRHNAIDWGRLYVSRFMRLYPLYLLAMILLLIVVAIRSDWSLHETPQSLLTNIVKWLGFTVVGNPNLNNIDSTQIMVAGVTWTLTYECFFYLALPILAITTRTLPPISFLAFGLLGVTLQRHYWHPNLFILSIFLGGVLAALLVRNDTLRRWATLRPFSLIILLCILTEFTAFKGSYRFIPLVLLTLSFCLIACGNDVFGILSHPASRMLGEISYGVYLLHGLVLFVYWKYIIGFERAVSLTAISYWLTQFCSIPILIAISYLTFRYIEKPAMRSVSTITERIKGQLRKKAGQRA